VSGGPTGVNVLINIKDIWNLETQQSHKKYVESVLSKSPPSKNPILMRLLIFHSHNIALASPLELRKIITDVKGWENDFGTKIFDDFILQCKGLFDYGRFSSKSTKDWSAYALCKSSKYRLCPYCQQALAVTIYRDRDAKAIRPTLDHFYAKHVYPYLALSLFNLIPSCHTCNSSLKGQIDFYLRPHLHPYEDAEVVRYTFDIHSYLERRRLGGASTQPTIKILSLRRKEDLYKQTKRFINTFLVRERLSLNEAEISRFVDLLMTYSNARIEEINNKIFGNSSFQLSEESALNFSSADYKNEWMGRLKRDLYEAAWMH
jgi:hypothetical protein